MLRDGIHRALALLSEADFKPVKGHVAQPAAFAGFTIGPKPPSGGSSSGKPVDKSHDKPEKPVYVPRDSAGGIVLSGSKPEEMALVWIRKTKQNPGYPTNWTFAKGQIDDGESKIQAALREVQEEMGMSAMPMAGGYLGSFKGPYNKVHYFLMIAKGKPGAHDKETEKVVCVPWEKALAKFAQYSNYRDIDAANAALSVLRTKYKIDALRGTELPDDDAEDEVR